MITKQKKSTRRRKKTTKKQWRLTHAIARLIIRTIKWLIAYLIKIIRKNPLAVFGFCLFLYFSFFLAYHVLFNENIISRSFFFHYDKQNHQDTAPRDLTIKTLLEDNNTATDTIHGMESSDESSDSLMPIKNNHSNKNSNPAFLNIVPQLKTPLTTAP